MTNVLQPPGFNGRMLSGLNRLECHNYLQWLRWSDSRPEYAEPIQERGPEYAEPVRERDYSALSAMAELYESGATAGPCPGWIGSLILVW